MFKVAAASLCALLLASASSASAQVFYEPVQYQYFSGGRAYYYGGSNPQVHYDANYLSHVSGYGRTQGYAFHSGNIDTHREVVTEQTRVYTDMIPYWNARIFGFTANDARNEAYSNAATYFRKADVARVARVQEDGTWVVPVQATSGAGTIEIRPYRPMVRPVVAEPKPILIIPKRLLDKPLWPSNNPTADAR
ncbi:MAG: hypothetical protein JWN40_5752 [Phycisphaerales bacterium]|nr:hypothetical protein [Phycisphaerales bacterium]